MRALIVTYSGDNESPNMVARALAERGVRPFRFDTDRFPGEIDVRIHEDAGGTRVLLRDGDDELDCADLVAVWHRRLRIGAGIPEDMEKQVRDASVEESRRIVYGLLASLPCFVLDPWPRLRIADNKQLQLERARAAGLEVPRTLMTNDPAAVREFWRECDGRMVTKMMTSFSVFEDGVEQVVFTNPVREPDLDALEGLRLCPMTFQEQLEKSIELRVTVVGREVFAASIDSNALERSKTDWRREGVALLGAWQPYDLPPEVRAGLLRVMDSFGLNYGAADFVVTPEGRHVFLEVNPAGEYYWLELENDLPISGALADVMIGRAERREQPSLASLSR